VRESKERNEREKILGKEQKERDERDTVRQRLGKGGKRAKKEREKR